MKTKPTCAAFVIAAIKALRLQPPNIVPRTAWAGVQLKTLYKVALDEYTSAQIERAINRLLAMKQLLAIRDGSEGEGSRTMKKLLPKVGPSLDAVRIGWCLNPQGKVFIPKAGEGKDTFVWFPNLYIATDDLPSRVRAIIAQEKRRRPKKGKVVRKTRARQIIDSM